MRGFNHRRELEPLLKIIGRVRGFVWLWLGQGLREALDVRATRNAFGSRAQQAFPTIAGSASARELCQHLERKPRGKSMRSNYAFERTVRHRGPRLAAARSSWPAAQRDR